MSTRRFVYDLWGRPQHSGASRTERKRSSESFAFGAHVNIHCLHGGFGGGGNTVNVCCAVICLSRMLLNPADPCGEQRKYPIFYQQISSKLQRHHRGITRFGFFRLWRLNVCLEPGDGFWVKHLRLRWLLAAPPFSNVNKCSFSRGCSFIWILPLLTDWANCKPATSTVTGGDREKKQKKHVLDRNETQNDQSKSQSANYVSAAVAQ